MKHSAMKAYLIILTRLTLLLLLVFSELASAQWDDDVLLLRPSNENEHIKKKKYKTKDQVEFKQKKQNATDLPEKNIESRKPNNTEENISGSESVKDKNKMANTFVDLWLGTKDFKSSSSWWYKNYSGNSMALGVSGRLQMDKNYIGFFEYETGFYYAIANAQLTGESSSMKDERYQIGFQTEKLIEFLNDKLLFLMSYAEKQENHNSISSDKTGYRAQGLNIKINKTAHVTNNLEIALGFNFFPIFKLQENPNKDFAFAGSNATGYESGVEFKITRKQSDTDSAFLKYRFLSTEVQFKDKSKLNDPIQNKQIEAVQFNEKETLILFGYQWSQ